MKKSEEGTLIMPGARDRNGIVVRKSKLLAISGPLQGEEFILDKDVFTIGSDPHNDLTLDDSTISRRHCELHLMSDSSYMVKDFGSTNGTLVNGVKVNEAFLGQGTELQLGNTKLVFCPVQQTRVYQISEKEEFGSLLGKSMGMRKVFHLAERYAPTDATILIQGETGTGKEILAEEIHNHSPRKSRPFVVIDCASLAKDIVESELFGHAKGAFTGATTDRMGAFEQANGGTVFLDEIGCLAPELQPKLLRVLEKREVKRVGTNKMMTMDVRIISATNRSLQNEVNANHFREDLFFRLSVVHIELPPLRRRKEDIPLLAMKFLKDRLGNGATSRLQDFNKAIEAFNNHDWPGNVRELRNVVEMACYGAHDQVDLGSFLYINRLKDQSDEADITISADRPFKDAKGDLIANFEKGYILDILKRNGNNISKAAREASIERAYLQRLIKKYGIES